ncbi:hypothetical protein E4Z66_19300 [Aliishimia ponticola]|uniref:Uncharacterized protein n=1 Tax=Aliishimia ponticola TaxID=2499833 RepID=A0A4S4NE06_9RHOB|nr:hypothetical protein [Aliishimia ponticola]THH34260.1 hypothetical protein E4Z66_19300 [Aliishimia ponticola]
MAGLADPAPSAATATASPKPRAKNLLGGIPRLDGGGLRQHVTGGRLVAAALLLLVVLMPALMFLLFVLFLTVIAGIFLAFGSDSVWETVARQTARFAARHPEQGKTLFRWLDSVACRWDLALDCFPDGTVDALYMPDFANFQSERDARKNAHDAAVTERLARLQSNG